MLDELVTDNRCSCIVEQDGTTVNIIIYSKFNWWPEDIKKLRKYLKKVEQELELYQE
jgi:hypothetical protein